MKTGESKSAARRKLIRFGSLAFGAISLKAMLPFIQNRKNRSSEKVKMLTADGKVVLVNKQQAKSTGKVKNKNKDILSWRRINSPKV